MLKELWTNIDMNLFITFCVLNIINVVVQTIKSISTIKCGKWKAAFVNAIAYGLYNVVVVYMVCELPLAIKSLVTALANLFGVYFVKDIEEKTEEDRLWKVEVTVPNELLEDLIFDSREKHLSFNCIEMDESYSEEHLINYYCKTKKDTEVVKDLILKYEHELKYFVAESQILYSKKGNNIFKRFKKNQKVRKETRKSVAYTD